MVCEKRSRKGRVSSESPDGVFVLETKASSNCEQNSVGLGSSLVVFRKNSLLSFLEEVLLGVFLKEGEVTTRVHQGLEGGLD